jgi:hypothetical protein
MALQVLASGLLRAGHEPCVLNLVQARGARRELLSTIARSNRRQLHGVC